VPVSAVLLSFNRPRQVMRVLDELAAIPEVDEVLVVDSSSDETPDLVRARGAGVRLLQPGDLGAAGRNHGAAAARNELVLMVDDDSYPEPGAVPRLVAAFDANPRLGVAGGLVRDVEEDGSIGQDTGLGSFDWWLRAGRAGAPAEGIEAFFFAEGGCMVRRDAFVAAGGFYEPYFFTLSEIDATLRLAADGWETRYFPDAVFNHLRPVANKDPSPNVMRLRTRNDLWHFWLRYPPAMAVPRMLGYGAFDLVESLYRGMPGAWLTGVREAWEERGTVLPDRRPIPRAVIRRVERNRGQMHRRLLAAQLRRRLLSR
jgi:GT2 family glycosyltransferase